MPTYRPEDINLMGIFSLNLTSVQESQHKPENSSNLMSISSFSFNCPPPSCLSCMFVLKDEVSNLIAKIPQVTCSYKRQLVILNQVVLYFFEQLPLQGFRGILWMFDVPQNFMFTKFLHRDYFNCENRHWRFSANTVIREVNGRFPIKLEYMTFFLFCHLLFI